MARTRKREAAEPTCSLASCIEIASEAEAQNPRSAIADVHCAQVEVADLYETAVGIADIGDASIEIADVGDAAIEVAQVGNTLVAGSAEKAVGDAAVQATRPEEVVGDTGVAHSAVEDASVARPVVEQSVVARREVEAAVGRGPAGTEKSNRTGTYQRSPTRSDERINDMAAPSLARTLTG